MSLTIDLSEGQIRNAIALAIAESFSGEKRDSLIRDIVRAHLQYKENSYDKETLLSKAVGKQIRAIADEEIAKKMEELKPKIQEIVRERLGERFENSIFEQLKSSLGRIIIQNISVNAEVDFED